MAEDEWISVVKIECLQHIARMTHRRRKILRKAPQLRLKFLIFQIQLHNLLFNSSKEKHNLFLIYPKKPRQKMQQIKRLNHIPHPITFSHNQRL